MLNNATITMLREMKLGVMADALSNQLEDKKFAELSFEERIGLLVDSEYVSRRNNRMKRLIQGAGFVFPDAALENIEYHADRKLDQALSSITLFCKTSYNAHVALPHCTILRMSKSNFSISCPPSLVNVYSLRRDCKSRTTFTVNFRRHRCIFSASLGVKLLRHNHFEQLLSKIRSYPHKKDYSDIKIGLEATGHYSKNITEFLRKQNLNVTVLNPLQVNLLHQATSLRKTRTDKSVAIFIAQMMFSRPQSSKQPVQSEIEELRELVRHRSRLVEMNAKFKVSVSRIISIVFLVFIF